MSLPNACEVLTDASERHSAHSVSSRSPWFAQPIITAVLQGGLGCAIILIAVYARMQPMPLSAAASVATGTTNTTRILPALTVSSVPTSPRVAGDSASSTPADTSSFGIVTAAAPSSPVLTTTCASAPLFTIGDVETSPATHPADEFNWLGAVDVVPAVQNPFRVGLSDTSEFPWRTSRALPETLATQIIFKYDGATLPAELTLSWSPGKVGEKAKQVLIDGEVLGTTQMRAGSLAPGWWEQMERYQDSFEFVLTPGEHTLMLEHIAPDTADAAVWDYIQLSLQSCE